MNKTQKTMTLNLTDKEMEVLELLSEKKGMNKTSLLKQALRLYQALDVRMSNGEKIYFEDDKKNKSELFLV